MSDIAARPEKILRKDAVFAREVTLGTSDSAENWQEVDEQEYRDYLSAQEAEADDVDIVLDAWEESL